MRKLPRSSRLSTRFGPTMIVSRRRGSGSDSGGGGTVVLGYVASVPNGKADLQLAFSNGAPSLAPAMTGRGLELFDYAEGAAPAAMDGGYGWAAGGGLLLAPHARRVGEEPFENYQEGAITGPAMTGGTGWAGAAALFAF
ncbi:MAG: hypothetical protein HZA90_26360 [Verrucomicrobia bacterium]|nr:hypothetical protein [Verrucomicrobiota bacterium]